MSALRFTGPLASLTPDALAGAALARRHHGRGGALPDRRCRPVRRAPRGRRRPAGLRARLRRRHPHRARGAAGDLRAALAQLPATLRAALERAARNLAPPSAPSCPRRHRGGASRASGSRRPDPLARVGVYAPGGRAAYPSSVLMGVIPAKVAGVRRSSSARRRGRTGCPPHVVLAAAAVAEVDRVFASEEPGPSAPRVRDQSVPRVDRIVGPGNAYVAEAKLQCAGASPSMRRRAPELLVLPSDVGRRCRRPRAARPGRARPGGGGGGGGARRRRRPAAAGTGRRACAAAAERSVIIRQALSSRGAVVVATALDEAVGFAERWAPST